MNRNTVVKVVVLGSSNVGKTSLIDRFMTNFFSSSRRATVGTDFHTRRIYLSDHETEIILQIWDTAGMEKFHSGTLGNSIYRGAHGALIVYDCADSSSFTQVEAWRQEVLARVDPDQYFPIVVIGNKVDLLDQEEVSAHSFVQSEPVQTPLKETQQSDPPPVESSETSRGAKQGQATAAGHENEISDVLPNQVDDLNSFGIHEQVVAGVFDSIVHDTSTPHSVEKDSFSPIRPPKPSSTLEISKPVDECGVIESIDSFPSPELSITCDSDPENSFTEGGENKENSTQNGFFHNSLSPTSPLSALDIISIVRILEHMPSARGDGEEGVDECEEEDDRLLFDVSEDCIAPIDIPRSRAPSRVSLYCSTDGDSIYGDRQGANCLDRSFGNYSVVSLPPVPTDTFSPSHSMQHANLTTGSLAPATSMDKLNASTSYAKLTLHDITAWCTENDYLHVQTSAKEGTGVETAIVTLASLAYDALTTKTWKDSVGSSVHDSIKISELYLPKNIQINTLLVQTFTNHRSTEIPADIMFPSMKLNILLVTTPASTEDIRRLNGLQARLPNLFAICLAPSTGSFSASDWDLFQSLVSGGKMRLLLSRNGPQEVVRGIVTKLYDSFRNTEKMAQQERFFMSLNRNLVSRETAQSILRCTFENLQIPLEEWEILMEAMPSIAHIMTASEETYLQSCPVSRETISKITRFFATDIRYV